MCCGGEKRGRASVEGGLEGLFDDCRLGSFYFNRESWVTLYSGAEGSPGDCGDQVDVDNVSMLGDRGNMILVGIKRS